MGGVGRRYAKVLLDALDGTAPDKVLDDLRAFGGWLADVPGMRIAIANPGIPFDVKLALLKELGEKAGLQPVSLRFIQLVVANRRLDAWKDILEAFTDLCDEKLGVVRARVATARPMDAKTLGQLSRRLAEAFGRPVDLEAGVSPALLGGMELRMGSTVYDGSVAGALRSLHRTLVKG